MMQPPFAASRLTHAAIVKLESISAATDLASSIVVLPSNCAALPSLPATIVGHGNCPPHWAIGDIPVESATPTSPTGLLDGVSASIRHHATSDGSSAASTPASVVGSAPTLASAFAPFDPPASTSRACC